MNLELLMANHKSAKKAHRHSLKRMVINRSRINRIRTFVKKAEKTLTTEQITNEERMNAIVNAEKELMRGVRKGVILQNTASRKVSRLVQKAKKINLAS